MSPNIVLVHEVSIVIVYDLSISKPLGEKNWLHRSMGNKVDKPSFAI